MKLYLGLLESSFPDRTRIFGELDGKLIDLRLACAACLSQGRDEASAYRLAGFYFPKTIAAFLEGGEQSRRALDEVLDFARHIKALDLRGPAGEKIAYDAREIRILPPLLNPERSFVIGFSDKARAEALPKGGFPTGFYKLPQTFVAGGAPILWPKFSQEVDADACLAIVIGKAGKRIHPEKAWEHVAGVALLVDITARDVNRREGLTSNNLLGKNFPMSSALGPALLLASGRNEVEELEVELSVDGQSRQQFALRQCLFSVEQIVAHYSVLGLKPGDFLAVGASMALQGNRLQSPVPLKIGSVIRCSSAAIGELSHRVISAESAGR